MKDRRIVWRGDIATALCIVSGGWTTEEERLVLLSAQEFVSKVREDAMKRLLPHCEKCGQAIP